MENVASENQNEGAPPDVDPGLLLESFRDAKSQGTSVSEAITLVANAFWSQSRDSPAQCPGCRGLSGSRI